MFLELNDRCPCIMPISVYIFASCSHFSSPLYLDRSFSEFFFHRHWFLKSNRDAAIHFYIPIFSLSHSQWQSFHFPFPMLLSFFPYFCVFFFINVHCVRFIRQYMKLWHDIHAKINSMLINKCIYTNRLDQLVTAFVSNETNAFNIIQNTLTLENKSI